MPKRHRSDLELEQQIFLGGQCSGKHSEYLFLSRMTPEDGFIFWFLKDLENMMKKKGIALVLDIIEKIGITEGLRGSSELTRLSMILGDTRSRTKIGKLWKKKAKQE